MMKKYVFFVLLLVIAVSVNAQRTYVLSVGVSEYKNENMNLKQAASDAQRVYDVFKKHTEDVTVITSQYATTELVTDKLTQICNNAKTEDRIIFFFSGHGFTGGICTYDDFIRYDEMLRILGKSKAKQVICFIDACRSGSVSGQEASNSFSWSSISNKENIVFYLSCKGDETSAESLLVSAGLFTNSLIKGLQGFSDRNKDKSITVNELFAYIYVDVVKHSNKKQHPQLIASKKSQDSAVLVW